MGRTTIRPGAGKRRVDGKSLRLADEVRYIQRRAADHDGRVVTVGQLVLFSTETGDAWLLDPADQLAARLARDGDPEPIHIEENDTTFAIGWKGRYRIEGPALSTSITIPVSSQPSLATRRISSNRPILKFQICLARFRLGERALDAVVGFLFAGLWGSACSYWPQSPWRPIFTNPDRVPHRRRHSTRPSVGFHDNIRLVLHSHDTRPCFFSWNTRPAQAQGIHGATRNAELRWASSWPSS